MGLYNRFCKRFFAAVIIRLTAQSDSRAPRGEAHRYAEHLYQSPCRATKHNKIDDTVVLVYSRT